MRKDGVSVPVKNVIPIDKLFGEDEEDTRLLQAMALYAKSYLEDFAWCETILDSWFGNGVGGVVAIFLFHIQPSRPDIDKWLWVIVGDVPPAYLVVDDAPTPSSALEGYIEEMSKWVKLAKRGKSSPKVIPVNATANPENALHLEDRLKTLSEMIVPRFRDSETQRT